MSSFLRRPTLQSAVCGGSPNGDGAAADGAAASDEIIIQPVGSEMRFEQTEFSVDAGQEVTIVFGNTATSPAMQYNVVVLNSNDDADVNGAGQEAVAAGEASLGRAKRFASRSPRLPNLAPTATSARFPDTTWLCRAR